jgi:hypothetical protein
MPKEIQTTEEELMLAIYDALNELDTCLTNEEIVQVQVAVTYEITK